jgi:hypothetical protein
VLIEPHGKGILTRQTGVDFQIDVRIVNNETVKVGIWQRRFWLRRIKNPHIPGRVDAGHYANSGEHRRSDQQFAAHENPQPPAPYRLTGLQRALCHQQIDRCDQQ